MGSKTFIDFPLMPEESDSIVLCRPYVPEAAYREVELALRSRWIGQGPRVSELEEQFSRKFADGLPAVAVNSGTAALHLAYVLAGIAEDDEVIAPVLSCVATSVPLLHQQATVKFADIQQDTLNIDPRHVRELISEATKAIVCTHYGGLPCDMDELTGVANEFGIPVIQDAAQALGATYRGRPIALLSDFTAFSFQAVKHITTGDGGMLVPRNAEHAERARRLRWLGIDRVRKHEGTWEHTITEIGYRYQMNDIAAAMGLAALPGFDEVLRLRRSLFAEYCGSLDGFPDVNIVGEGYHDREHAAWLFTVLVEDRVGLQRKLWDNKIESHPVHFRNDEYEVFSVRHSDLPNMDRVQDNYLVLPLHPHMNVSDVHRVCECIRSGW